ncbi:MAG: cyclic nucleotide-binding domain-containing protein [Acidimicrobiia bacterium]
MALLKRQSDKAEALRRVPMFSTLARKDLAEMARHVDEVSVPAGTVLAREGEQGNAFYLILEGEAVVRRKDRKIATLGKGDCFGEMAIIDGQPRSATVAVTADAVILEMHRRDFSYVLDRSPGFARRLLVVLSARLREADTKLIG